jgi:hypothetical protein
MAKAGSPSDTTGVSPFHGATNIVFEYRDFENPDAAAKRFSITAWREIRSLVSSIRLKPFAKGVPWDLHCYSATFQSPSKETRVSFCRVCFNTP